MGLRVLSSFIMNRLFLLSKTDDWLHRYLQFVKEATPKPCLVPIVSFYRPPGEDQKFDVDCNTPGEKEFYFLMAGVLQEVLVSSLETQNRLKCLKGHEKNVTVVKFCSDSSRVVSGFFDNKVIIWNWQSADSPSIILSGHTAKITSLSLSSDDSRLFSGSRDGSVKMWDTAIGRLCNNFRCGAPVECLSASHKTKIVAIGTRDGRLRCVDRESAQCVFEHRPVGDVAVTAVMFGANGRMLVCGSAVGKAISMSSKDWTMVASTDMSDMVTHIAFHPDGTNALLGSRRTEPPFGEIRNWIITEEKLATYTFAGSYPVNGLSFRNNGKDIVVGLEEGLIYGWSGPVSNPGLDFEAARKNMIFDFALSGDATRAASSAYDSILRIWRTDTGTQVAEYSVPENGSRRLALSRDGMRIASASPKGIIRIWNPEMTPCEKDI